MVEVNLQTKSFFQKEMVRYCDQISLKDIPLLIYTEEELRMIDDDDKKIAKTKKHNLGESWSKGQIEGVDQPIIYINPDNSDFLWQTIDTLVHELVHIRFPHMDHGDDFQETVNSIVMGVRY